MRSRTKKTVKVFAVFEHPIQFDKDEIKVLYPERQIAQWDWDDLEFKTGCVPLYSSEIYNDIEGALEKLRREQNEFGKPM